MRKLLLLALTVSLTVPASAQWFDWTYPLVPRTDAGKVDTDAPAPRTAGGDIDLSGLWVPVDASGSLYDSSRLRGWARDAMASAKQSFYRSDPRLQCLPAGPGLYAAADIAGGSRRIVQHPQIIAVLNEDMTHRQIYMDGRPLEAETLLPSWLGYSVGSWEGDTLIVKTNGFNDKTWLSDKGIPHTDQLHLTERYTRSSYGHMQLEITYRDPGTFLDGAVQATIELELRPETTMFEVVCNESKTSRRHYAGEMEQSEQKAVAVAEDTLREYVGTYQGYWGSRPVTAEVTLEEGELVLKRTPRYSLSGGNNAFDITRLIPQSENAFDSGIGLGWVFNRDESGAVVNLSEVHVSGAWALQRIE